MSDYVSLHNHTFFSLLDSLLSPKELLMRAKELGQKAVAITDHGSLANAWDAYKAAKEIGIKYIPGCECYFVNDVNKKDEKVRHVILLAKNAAGYRNLLLLNRQGFENSLFFAKRVYPLIDWQMLRAHSEGLICLTACGQGIVSQLLNNKKFPEAEETVKKLQEIFGDNLGLEIQPNNLKRFASAYNDSIEQYFTNFHTIRLAKKLGVRIVPTSNAHYLKKEDSDTHDVLLAIGAGQPTYSNARTKYDVADFFLHSEDEVRDFFSRTNPIDEVNEWIKNTSYFADQCEEPKWIDPKFSNPTGKELPIFPVEGEADYEDFVAWKSLPENSESVGLEIDKAYLRYLCAKDSYKRMPNDHRRAEYDARLKEELEVIEYHGFSSYMLIVADYIRWARNNNILVGYGRGSVGGSLIAYLLDIHRADPIQYQLIFARFHNKEKTSFPDIDTDFAPSGRNLVQDYVRRKYGTDHVAHVSNVNTITPKVFARDISRSCELGGSRQAAVDVGNAVADSLPADVKNIEKAMEEAPLFVEYTKRYPQFLKYASICGKYRAWSTHAGGLLISARPLAGLVPLRKDKDGAIAIEYDKDRAEENGLVKMDMLGLETLDIIKETFSIIKAAGKPLPPDMGSVPWDDQDAYDLIARGDTFCVFQLGTSSGTIDLCKKVKPKNIEDISAINSLARPAARDIREDFIKTKEGHKPVNLLHPSLNRAFGGTYGFGLYEECLMYLAQDVAGWSLHEADRLRKLTKEKGKNPKKAAQWRKDFIEDAKKNRNIPENIATRIWDEVVDKFQGYGFNLSHSILYSMMSYYTAYLKAHYPVEFLMANLKSEIQSNMKTARNNIEKIKSEIRKHNVKILPPDINRSNFSYTLHDAQTLITGFEALKFVGEDAIREVIEKRPFKNFFDFMVRCDSKALRSNTIQALAATGCLDGFGLTRKQVFLYCSDYRKKLQSWLKKHDPNKAELTYPWPAEADWALSEKYALEKTYLGEAFVCSKKQGYAPFFNDSSQILVSYVRNCVDKKALPSMKVEVKSIFEFKVKKENSKSFGQEMAKLTVEDVNGDQCSLTIFPEKYRLVKERMKQLSKGKHKLEDGICIHFSGVTNFYEDETGILLDNFYNYAPPPSVPADLKAKKVSLRISKPKETKPDADKNEIFSDLEDELFDEGLIEFNDPEDDDDDDDGDDPVDA